MTAAVHSKSSKVNCTVHNIYNIGEKRLLALLVATNKIEVRLYIFYTVQIHRYVLYISKQERKENTSDKTCNKIITQS